MRREVQSYLCRRLSQEYDLSRGKSKAWNARSADRLSIPKTSTSAVSCFFSLASRRSGSPYARRARERCRPICSIVPYDAVRDWQCFDADARKDTGREVREYFIPDFSNWKDHDSYTRGFDRRRAFMGPGSPRSPAERRRAWSLAPRHRLGHQLGETSSSDCHCRGFEGSCTACHSVRVPGRGWRHLPGAARSPSGVPTLVSPLPSSCSRRAAQRRRYCEVPAGSRTPICSISRARRKSVSSGKGAVFPD
jgi:hypothetical protein